MDIMQTNEDKEFLRTEPLGKLLLRLALPTVTAQLINMLYNIVDRIYIGHIPDIGATALTGVGVCMPLIMIVSAFAALVGYGGAPRASIFMGKQVSEILDTMASFNSKDDFKMNGKEGFDLGVTQIPEILRDNTDRNRTSPFAFTGKVGS